MPGIKAKNSFILIVFFILVLATSCATYYMKTIDFQQYIITGQFDKADKWLEKDKKGVKGKNQLLHFMNRGYVSWILDKPDESNFYFQVAENMIEDYIKNYYLEALTYVSNPTITPYKPEDFETVLVNYFMALNYLKKNQLQEAIVECKRINIKLNLLNDKHKDHKNKYQRDAFAHVLMGLIYDANKNYNDAFIAYRNALEVYENDYQKYFDIKAPKQLKLDLLRTAYLTGFHEEVEFYEKKFEIKYDHNPSKNGELVFLWMNGYGPVKTESSINFTKIPNSKAGYITLVNDEHNLSFPMYIGNKSYREKTAFEQLRFFRIAFPKYIERNPVFIKATLKSNSGDYPLEELQNINDIAFKTLQDRMIRELSSAIGRLAAKKALELLADEQDENLGTIINIINTATEKADTRNWQTLPYSISYSRIPLKEGKNEISLTTITNDQRSKTNTFSFDGNADKIYFHAFHSIASQPLPNQRYYY